MMLGQIVHSQHNDWQNALFALTSYHAGNGAQYVRYYFRYFIR